MRPRDRPVSLCSRLRPAGKLFRPCHGKRDVRPGWLPPQRHSPGEPAVLPHDETGKRLPDKFLKIQLTPARDCSGGGEIVNIRTCQAGPSTSGTALCQNLYAAPTKTTSGLLRPLSNMGSYFRPAEMFQRRATLKSKPPPTLMPNAQSLMSLATTPTWG